MKTRLWTILEKGVWNKLTKEGCLIQKEENIDRYFLSSYTWMAAQMRKRIDNDSKGCELPMWAWYQAKSFRGQGAYEGRKPDLREVGHLPKGVLGFRVEFEKEFKDVLLSDFELWHYALNRWYLPNNLQDAEQVEHQIRKYSKVPFDEYPSDFRNLIERSWDRIFDMDFSSKDIALPMNQKQIQATFWELKIEEITQVVPFVAR